MSYDLAVWVGRRPESDEAASVAYEQLMDRMEAGDFDAEPSPRIREYVDALLAHWPDITEDSGEDSPWADGPLLGNAFGGAIYFPIVRSRADEASAFAAKIAKEHGLVCYDPQTETLRPPARLYRLEATSRRNLGTPSPEVVTAVIEGLPRDGYALLESVREPEVYIQAWLRPDGSFQLELRDGSVETHVLTRSVSRERVAGAFSGWLAEHIGDGDAQWRERYQWNDISEKLRQQPLP